MARYRYFTNHRPDGTTVICVSRFAGKAVRGVAKCHSADDFDEEIGRKLAKLRCDLKVAQKRHKRANDKEVEARRAVLQAQELHNKAMGYFVDSLNEQEDAQAALEKFEKELRKNG